MLKGLENEPLGVGATVKVPMVLTLRLPAMLTLFEMIDTSLDDAVTAEPLVKPSDVLVKMFSNLMPLEPVSRVTSPLLANRLRCPPTLVEYPNKIPFTPEAALDVKLTPPPLVATNEVVPARATPSPLAAEESETQTMALAALLVEVTVKALVPSCQPVPAAPPEVTARASM